MNIRPLIAVRNLSPERLSLCGAVAIPPNGTASVNFAAMNPELKRRVFDALRAAVATRRVEADLGFDVLAPETVPVVPGRERLLRASTELTDVSVAQGPLTGATPETVMDTMENLAPDGDVVVLGLGEEAAATEAPAPAPAPAVPPVVQLGKANAAVSVGKDAVGINPPPAPKPVVEDF